MSEWKKRRGIVNAILNDVGEGTGKSNKELKKLIGFEDDADAGVDLPALTLKYAKSKAAAAATGPQAKKARIA